MTDHMLNVRPVLKLLVELGPIRAHSNPLSIPYVNAYQKPLEKCV